MRNIIFGIKAIKDSKVLTIRQKMSLLMLGFFEEMLNLYKTIILVPLLSLKWLSEGFVYLLEYAISCIDKIPNVNFTRNNKSRKLLGEELRKKYSTSAVKIK